MTKGKTPCQVQPAALTRIRAKMAGSTPYARMHITAHHKAHTDALLLGAPGPGCVLRGSRGGTAPMFPHATAWDWLPITLQQQEMQMLSDIPEMNGDRQR